MKKIGSLLLFSSLLLSACIANVGNSVGVPDVSQLVKTTESRPSFLGRVSIGEIADVRSHSLTTNDGKQVTEPNGDVSQKLAEALAQVLLTRGIEVVENAPLKLNGKVLRWHSLVTGVGGGSLSSEASLQVELIDNTGGAVRTGTYHGSRSSQFPIISRNDIEDSLAIAMSEALEHLAQDKSLIEQISKTKW